MPASLAKAFGQEWLAGAADFDRLLGKLRNQLTDLSPEIKRRIIQTLIHKVVVTKDGFELHFYAGMDQIKKGEVIASPSFSGSSRLTA